TQCGLGTLMKALAHGVPVVCLPVLGDQPDNAARVVFHRAGVRLGPDATSEDIASACTRVLGDASFAAAARRLAPFVAAGDAAETAAMELESLVAHVPR